MDFPQYYHTFHGKTVAKFLRGEFGGIDQVSPYLASLAYALDRAAVKRKWMIFYIKGVISSQTATQPQAWHIKALNSKLKRRKRICKMGT